MVADTKSSIIRKKLMEIFCFFGRSFNHSKCKTQARLAASRIKLLRNKREEQLRQMRRDIARLLQSKQDDTARIRVEHLIREQNVMAANEIIDLFCELIVVRLPIIAKQKECPVDLKEGIASLIYAAPRCSEIPELQSISDLFLKKYGKEFVSAAKGLRPQSGVNHQLITKLSDKKPSGEVKLKLMKEIAEEYKVDWDMASSVEELLKPPEELIAGPTSFVSASDMPVKHVSCNHTNALDASSTKAVPIPVTKSSELLDSQSSSIESNYSSGTKNNTAINLKQLSDSRSFHASSTTAEHDEEDVTNLGEERIVRNKKAGSDIKFDDSDGLDSDVEENVKINGRLSSSSSSSFLPPPSRPAPVVPCRIVHESESRRTSTSCNAAARVHPKLPPDYDSLVAHLDSMRSNRR